jgi:large subunit ribosomal protein L30
MAGKPESQAKLKVTQTKSTISHIARNRATIKALGLHGIGSTSIVPDNAATRGMVRQVRFLVTVEEIGGESTTSQRTADDGSLRGPRRRSGEPSARGFRGDAPVSHRSEDSKR